MSSPSALFLKELESFRVDAESAVQFFYTHHAINQVAGKNRIIKSELDKEAHFWNITLAALQTSGVIALGRIFDQESKHNIDRLLQICQKHIAIFSKAALRRRKLESSWDAPEWIDNYMTKTFEPSQDDFRRLRKHILKFRKVYEARYRNIRHKVYAHSALDDRGEVHALFSQTKLSELQKLVIFLVRLHCCLRETFQNGRRLVLPRMRYSIIELLNRPTPRYRSISAQERTILSAKKFLESLSTRTA